jgi:hypothetical protein
MSKILIKLRKSGDNLDLRFTEFKGNKRVIEHSILLLKSEITKISSNGSYQLIKDIHSYSEVYNNGDTIKFKVTILNFDLSYKKGTFEYRELYILTKKFIQFYKSNSKELVIASKEPIYMAKIEIRGNMIHQVRRKKHMYNLFLKQLNRLATWRFDKIVIVNDYSNYSFYFQTYNGENRGINGGIIWHRHDNRYSIHT